MKPKTFVLSACCVLLLLSTARAQDACSFQTIHARYGATCQGFVFAGPGNFTPGASLSPFSLLGICKGNATGYFTCSGTQSIGGVIIPAPAAGQSIVNPNCGGQITYNKGTPQQLIFNFLILHHGNELHGMLQNPGSAVQCDLVRMDSDDNDGDDSLSLP